MNQMCVPSLDNCSEQCFCYHSWKFENSNVANCSGVPDKKMYSLPEVLNDSTAHLILSQNHIKSFCESYSYLRNVVLLDLTWNKLENICPHVLMDMLKLKHLVLTNNLIKHIDLDLEQNINITTLFLNNNLLTNFQNLYQK